MPSDDYLVLTYRCDVCGKTETIWNAREGAVPFSIPCTKHNCHSVMSRSDRHTERRRKNFPLVRGSRYFVNLTLDEAKAQAGKRCAQLLQDGRLSAADYDSRFSSLVASFFGAGNEPHLIVRT